MVFARAADYITFWGVWPTEDSAKRSLDVETVATAQESLYRLPAILANKLYDVGETGMGYYVYTVVLRDGRRLPVTTGGLVDFPALPDGVTTFDIADVEPGVGDGRFGDRAPLDSESPRDYVWCLYED